MQNQRFKIDVHLRKEILIYLEGEMQFFLYLLYVAYPELTSHLFGIGSDVIVNSLMSAVTSIVTPFLA